VVAEEKKKKKKKRGVVFFAFATLRLSSTRTHCSYLRVCGVSSPRFCVCVSFSLWPFKEACLLREERSSKWTGEGQTPCRMMIITSSLRLMPGLPRLSLSRPVPSARTPT
jgi:hypothetical protein